MSHDMRYLSIRHDAKFSTISGRNEDVPVDELLRVGLVEAVAEVTSQCRALVVFLLPLGPPSTEVSALSFWSSTALVISSVILVAEELLPFVELFL
jgi:hypothetical protein